MKISRNILSSLLLCHYIHQNSQIGFVALTNSLFLVIDNNTYKAHNLALWI